MRIAEATATQRTGVRPCACVTHQMAQQVAAATKALATLQAFLGVFHLLPGCGVCDQVALQVRIAPETAASGWAAVGPFASVAVAVMGQVGAVAEAVTTGVTSVGLLLPCGCVGGVPGGHSS